MFTSVFDKDTVTLIVESNDGDMEKSLQNLWDLQEETEKWKLKNEEENKNHQKEEKQSNQSLEEQKIIISSAPKDEVEVKEKIVEIIPLSESSISVNEGNHPLPPLIF